MIIFPPIGVRKAGEGEEILALKVQMCVKLFPLLRNCFRGIIYDRIEAVEAEQELPR